MAQVTLSHACDAQGNVVCVELGDEVDNPQVTNAGATMRSGDSTVASACAC
jgi:hypothetical protein